MSTTINTREQLAALPVGTQVLDRDGLPMTKTAEGSWASTITSASILTGTEHAMTLGEDEISGAHADDGTSRFFPLTVLP